MRIQARLPIRWFSRVGRKVLESPVFWAAFLQAVGAIVVALIDRG